MFPARPDLCRDHLPFRSPRPTPATGCRKSRPTPALLPPPPLKLISAVAPPESPPTSFAALPPGSALQSAAHSPAPFPSLRPPHPPAPSLAPPSPAIPVGSIATREASAA